MCKAGGPRCDGKGRRTAAAATVVDDPAHARDAQDDAAARSGGGVPTREMADKLAAGLAADRKGWDGQPLNERDRRLYALRESGYKGPIDQDGYPDTTSEGAGILRRMAEQRGETPSW